MVFAKLFSSRAQRAEDASARKIIDGIYRAAVGDLGAPDSMPLALYCVSVIAGYAIQQVALADRITRGVPHRAPEVIAVTTSSGHTFVFGDAIAGALMHSGNQPGFIELMANQGNISSWYQDVSAWFKTSAAAVGSENYGRPSTPLDEFNWPAINDVVSNADAVVEYLKGGGLSPDKFGDILTNAARLALLRAADNRHRGTLEDFAVLGIEAAIAGSHILPAQITTEVVAEA